MSALGQQRTFRDLNAMSALPRKRTFAPRNKDVCFGQSSFAKAAAAAYSARCGAKPDLTAPSRWRFTFPCNRLRNVVEANVI